MKGVCDNDRVILETSDQITRRVPWSLIKHMGTVRNMVKDTGIETPLHISVVCETVDMLIYLLTVDTVHMRGVTPEELLTLLHAVNYLDIFKLFPMVYAALADCFVALNDDAEEIQKYVQRIPVDLLKQLIYFFPTKKDIEVFQQNAQLPWLGKFIAFDTFRYISNNNNWAIWCAAANGHRDVVELLLNTPGRGIDPGDNDNAAIREAARYGHRDIVELLLNTPGRGIRYRSTDTST